MSITYKTSKEIEYLTEGGKRLADVMLKLVDMVKPGVTTKEIDMVAQELIKKLGDKPAFLGYRSSRKEKPYPAAVCTSINDELVHCIPSDVILKEGDIISLDCGLKHQNLFTDHAVTVGVGKLSIEAQNLINDTKKSLQLAIDAAQPGSKVGDIGWAVESFVNGRYGIVKELAGHGVGYGVHEDPYIPNYGTPGTGITLREGMVIAIEPMLHVGGPEIITEDYTIRTKDGSLSAHFEHTVAITKDGPQILTLAS